MSTKFQRLTRSEMRKLPPGWQISEHGIVFERLPNGDGRFSINVMVDRQRIHRVVGRESDGTTRTQAEEAIAKLRNDAKFNRLSLPRGRKVALSFRQAAEMYLDRLQASGGKDLKAKGQRLELHLVPFFGQLPLSKVSTFEVERYKKSRSEERSLRGGDRVSEAARMASPAPSESAKPTSPATINRELAVLSHLLNKALEWGWVDRPPAKIRRLKEGGGRIDYLSAAEVAKLTECARQDPNPFIYPFILISLETSMRRMEVLSIRREFIQLSRRVIYIPKAKAGAREQPITKRLAEYLAEYLEQTKTDSPWLFPSRGASSGHVVSIEKPFRRVVQAAGLDPRKIVRHTLRHTAVTHLVQAGVDLPTVKRISGHKTLAMVERYAHQNGAHLEAAMDRLEDRLKIA